MRKLIWLLFGIISMSLLPISFSSQAYAGGFNCLLNSSASGCSKKDKKKAEKKDDKKEKKYTIRCQNGSTDSLSNTTDAGAWSEARMWRCKGSSVVSVQKQ